MHIPVITVLSPYAVKPQMEYPVPFCFLPLFSAPWFVLPYETGASIK